MSAINSPGACLSLKNKVVLWRDLPALGILIFGKIWDCLFPPGHVFPGILKKRFALVDTQKVPRAVLVVCLPHTRLLSQPQNPEKPETRERLYCSWPDVAWRFSGRIWSLMPCRSDPGCTFWALLTLVSQGCTRKDPASVRRDEGQP